MPGYTVDHWQEVKEIIVSSTQINDEITFKTHMVSDSDGEIDVIHKRIIHNIYDSDIVICDISGKNPNVLFELGMRLTFDKPTIIIKDDHTDFMFDTGVIEHLEYPKDLRFQKIVKFKELLARRIKATYDKSITDTNFSTFLKNFGTFNVPKLEQSELSDVNQYLLEELKNLHTEIKSIRKDSNPSINKNNTNFKFDSSDLEQAISMFIYNNNNIGDINPIEIYDSDEFISFMEKLELNVYAYKKLDVISTIEKIQIEKSLPF